jgi:hypothetical protein
LKPAPNCDHACFVIEGDGIGIGPSRRFGPGRACRLCPGTSDINLLCYGQRVVDLNPKVADCALDLRMAEEYLHGAEISGALVDQRRLSAPQRVGAVEARIKPDARYPLRQQASILSCCQASPSASSAKQWLTWRRRLFELRSLLTQCARRSFPHSSCWQLLARLACWSQGIACS